MVLGVLSNLCKGFLFTRACDTSCFIWFGLNSTSYDELYVHYYLSISCLCFQFTRALVVWLLLDHRYLGGLPFISCPSIGVLSYVVPLLKVFRCDYSFCNDRCIKRFLISYWHLSFIEGLVIFLASVSIFQFIASPWK